jgi:hypothetical protein
MGICQVYVFVYECIVVEQKPEQAGKVFGKAG